MFWFKDKEKRKFKTVQVLHFSIRWTDLQDLVETMTYILKENGLGERKVDIHSYGHCKLNNKEEQNDLYAKTILPWLNHVPDKYYEEQSKKTKNPPQKPGKKKAPKKALKKKDNVIFLDKK